MHRLRLFLRHGLVSSGCPTASRRICALLPTTSILSQSSSSSRRLPPASPMTAAPPVRFSPTSSSLTLDPPYNRSLSLPPLSPPIRAWVRPHTPGPLSPTQLEQFYQWGYVTVPHLLHPSDLHPSMRAIEAQVDEVARALHRAGRLSDLCEGADFRTRLTRLEAQSPSASVLLHKRGQLPQAMWGLWSHPRLMAIAQQVLGPDVSGQHLPHPTTLPFFPSSSITHSRALSCPSAVARCQRIPTGVCARRHLTRSRRRSRGTRTLRTCSPTRMRRCR